MLIARIIRPLGFEVQIPTINVAGRVAIRYLAFRRRSTAVRLLLDRNL